MRQNYSITLFLEEAGIENQILAKQSKKLDNIFLDLRSHYTTKLP